MHVGKHRRLPRPENIPGATLYVDHTCIDCDTCRWMAPDTFARVGGASAVTAQPASEEARLAALQAMISCPTFSIHATDARPGELAAARDSFPLRVPGTGSVYHLGHHNKASFGAASYLIVRRAGGNVMVDTPRWTPHLAQRLATLGGVDHIFLTHRDDVGDHALWAARFGSRRIIHAAEENRRQGTDAAECKLTGEGPWEFDGFGDMRVIFTPGHTAGCISLLYHPDRALFTGDHLAYSARLGRMTAFPGVCWHSFPLQLESVEKLADPTLDFLHILPGHGGRRSFASGEERRAALRELLQAEAPRHNAHV